MNPVARLWFKFVFVYLAGAVLLVALAVWRIAATRPSGGQLFLWIALPAAWLLLYEPLMVWREWRRVKELLRGFREGPAPGDLDAAVEFFATLGARETGLPRFLVRRLLRTWGRRALEERLRGP